MSMPSTPYETDLELERVASEAGNLKVHRFSETVYIDDPDAIPKQYFRSQPDKRLIRKALQDGIAVPGCRLVSGWTLREESEPLPF